MEQNNMAAHISHENWENQVGKINSELSQKMFWNSRFGILKLNESKDCLQSTF